MLDLGFCMMKSTRIIMNIMVFMLYLGFLHDEINYNNYEHYGFDARSRVFA